MHQKLNQKGFSAIETLLVIVVFAIVGATSYYVFQANKKANDTLSSATKIAQNSPKASKAKTQKKSTLSTNSPADDKTAILAAIKQKIEQKPLTDQNGNPITFTYTVDSIVGLNAKGIVDASAGDPGIYYAHKEKDQWSIVYTNHIQPQDGQICVQYDMPADWCAQ